MVAYNINLIKVLDSKNKGIMHIYLCQKQHYKNNKAVSSYDADSSNLR